VVDLITTHNWASAVDPAHIAEIRRSADQYAAGGLLHLVLEVLAYPLDEAAPEGTTTWARVVLHGDGSISVEDNGRGTDTRYDEAGVPMVKPIMATRDLRFFGVPDAEVLPDGRPRSGMSVVAALSSWLTHTNRRVDGRGWVQRYERGLPPGPATEIEAGDTTGTLVRFLPDPDVFGPETLSAEALRASFADLDIKIKIEVLEESPSL
jgi:DNA gyrase subunit B